MLLKKKSKPSKKWSLRLARTENLRRCCLFSSLRGLPRRIHSSFLRARSASHKRNKKRHDMGYLDLQPRLFSSLPRDARGTYRRNRVSHSRLCRSPRSRVRMTVQTFRGCFRLRLELQSCSTNDERRCTSTKWGACSRYCGTTACQRHESNQNGDRQSPGFLCAPRARSQS